MDFSPSEQLEHFYEMQQKFSKACSQVVLLNNRILDVQTRYDRAVKNGRRSARYVARLDLATLEGVRNMLYNYACARAEKLDRMQDGLVRRGVMTSGIELQVRDDTEQQIRDNMEHMTTTEHTA